MMVAGNWFQRWKPDLIDTAPAAHAWRFQEQLAVGERMAFAQIEGMVARQAGLVLEQARTEVDYYRQRLPRYPKVRPGTTEWLALPLLDRVALQENGHAMKARQLPLGHQLLGVLRSSGSTGMPVEVLTTNITNTWQKALALRAARWTERDFTTSLGVIRKVSNAPPPDGVQASSWGDATGFPMRSGKSFHLDAQSSSTAEQRAWLERQAPGYLMTYPSLLRELVLDAMREPMPWRPRGISTLGETVDEELRGLVRELWDIRIDDVYSAEECGLIAIQCSAGNYHVQSECVLVEVLDEHGRPCGPGEVGRVVVTTLSNMASPLIRYALGDYARVGGACRCGVHLPVLEQIMGRERNLLVTDRGKFWPSFGTRRFRDVAPLVAQQFRQTAPDAIEMHYVARAPLDAAQISVLTGMVQKSLPVPMKVSLKAVDELPRAASGKFELFVSAMGQPAA